jgi:hypothetical protein
MLYLKALKVMETLEIEETEEYFQANLKAFGIMDIFER